MKKLSVFMILIIVGVTLLVVKGGPIVDQLNPFIKEDIYYTVVDNDGEYEAKSNGFGRWNYKFKGYDESGKEQKIVMTSSKHLRIGAYLKIKSKGTYGMKWEEIQDDEIPAKAKEKVTIKHK
ncbi:TPA: YxeA family protein [Bacillus cereus]|uniref:YxeA family protein n=1 Tax=Bacillus cereus TaxID=1396 RepID=A0A1D3NS07_BACCE|nr:MULTISPECIES: YxeA family protein [Bacillus]MCP1180826.1 YxeA family protein [Bacillus sp. 1663tsa1]MCP1282769.1 YxeA family protein [Bacillus sp. S0635]MCQ6347025.1 YxeA family protein [Bacillus cereus]MCU5459488.1 YxeA family protein [Bacillus cereus]MCU5750040.1 YxeA family protein [Bacillus cereus]